MATNKFFENGFTNNPSSINLLDDLTRELIEIWGQDFFYMPRTLVKPDQLLGEDTLSVFKKAWEVEMIMTQAEGFGPEGELMGKEGWWAKKQLTLQVSMTKFREITKGLYEPHPGDLVYHRLSGAIYQVDFVNDGAATQWALGNTEKYFYTLICNMFEYSHERIVTGEGILDDIATGLFNDGTDSNGLKNDGGADNAVIDRDGSAYTDFSETSPLGSY